MDDLDAEFVVHDGSGEGREPVECIDGVDRNPKRVDWAEAEREFVETTISVRDLAAKLGVSRQRVDTMRRKHDWDTKRKNFNGTYASYLALPAPKRGWLASPLGGGSDEPGSRKKNQGRATPEPDAEPESADEWDPLERHRILSDRISAHVEITLIELERKEGMHPRSRAEALKVLADAADRAVRLAREVRGIKTGVASAKPDGDTEIAEVVIRREVVPAPPRDASKE